MGGSKTMIKEIVKSIFPEAVRRFERGECTSFGVLIEETKFRDVISKKEYQISGLCQDCQDQTFN